MRFEEGIGGNVLQSTVLALDHAASLSEDRLKEVREVFKWLPTHQYSTDMEYGMQWMVWSSMLATAIPVLSLIFETGHGMETEAQIRAKNFMFVFLAIAGFFFTLGSEAMKRAVSYPPKRSIFKYYHCTPNELLGMWLFTIGTAMAVPCMGIYYSIYHSWLYLSGLLASIGFLLGTLFVTYLCYPRSNVDDHNIFTPYIIPCLQSNFGFQSSKIRGSFLYHIQNDLLLASWTFVVGSCVVTTGAVAMFIYAIVHEEDHLLFDASSSAVDLLGYTIGATYFLAGAYPQDYTVDVDQNHQNMSTSQDSHGASTDTGLRAGSDGSRVSTMSASDNDGGALMIEM
jgi:hypothetical protein